MAENVKLTLISTIGLNHLRFVTISRVHGLVTNQKPFLRCKMVEKPFGKTLFYRLHKEKRVWRLKVKDLQKHTSVVIV